jgi:hypothetical protein
MTKTIGERAVQEANAQKARGWLRDLWSEVFGFGEYRHSDGRLHKMRHDQREARLERVADGMAGGCWVKIDMMAVQCARHLQAFELDICGMLDMLRAQTPDIFSWFDDHQPLALAHVTISGEVSHNTLGRFRAHDFWEDTPDMYKAMPHKSYDT